MLRLNLSFNRMIKAALVLLLSMLVLAACSEGVEDESRVLRIGITFPYSSSLESYLRTNYINLFAVKNTHIDFELIFLESELEPNEDGIGQFLQTDPAPDVIISSPFTFSELMENNLVQSLESYVMQSELRTEEMVPAVIGRLRELGNGQLYSMTPGFTSHVLIYNKDLFAAADVEEPRDGMTWDELFVLAQRLHSGTGDNQVIGFSFHYYVERWFSLLQSMPYLKSLGLHVLNHEGTSMNVATEDWANAWGELIKLYRKDAFSHEDNFQLSPMAIGRGGNAFFAGKKAMTLIDDWGLGRVSETNLRAEVMDGYNTINYDIVTMPVHPEARDIGGDIYTSWMFSINAAAEHPEDAWQFIEYVHSEEWASIKHHSINDYMVIYPQYLEWQIGIDYNAKAFYELLAPPLQSIDHYRVTDEDLFEELDQLGTQLFKEAVEGSKTVTEALAAWQEDGNELLQERLKEEDK